MAAAIADVNDEEKFMECGMCFENDDLKRLPCNPDHIYCVTCLGKESEITKIIKCPFCSTVIDEGIDDIPSAGAPLDKFICCDVCMRKDDKRNLAQIYCVICQKKFCKPHMDAHNFALDDHKRITMDEYRKEYRKVEIRHCEKHTDQVYSVACKKCNEVFCVNCILRPQPCTDNRQHHMMELRVVTTNFVKRINDKKQWIFAKEEQLLGLVEVLTRLLSDYDRDTEETIAKLHTARDKQIQSLRQKYEKAEKKLIKLRTQSKREMTRLLDDDVGNKLDRITRGVKKIDCRLSTHHQVDIVRGMEEMERLTTALMNIEIPRFEPSQNDMELEYKDTWIKPSIEITVNGTLLTSLLTGPTSLMLLREQKVSNGPESVCHHQQYTYVGCEGSVDRISEDGLVEKRFISIDGFGSSVTVYDDRLYVLVGKRCENFKIQQLELSGKLVQSWVFPIQYIDCSKHCIVNQKIIIPDLYKGQMLVYTMDGNIEFIPCGLCTGVCTAMATIGDNSVVVTVGNTNTVFRINIDSGEVMWTSRYVDSPEGVVCYENRYVLVTSPNSNSTIWMLDADTGDNNLIQLGTI